MNTNETTTENTVQENEATETIEKTYTKEEVDKLLQSETDRRVSSALKKAAADKEKAVLEAKKLAAMDAQQRKEYEVEQLKNDYESKLKELSIRENTATCKAILSDKGISPELAKYVVADTAEEMDANIKEFEKYFKASVKAEVEKRLAGSNPKKNLPLNETIDKAAFRKMSLAQQNQLYKTNPELYKTLI